MLIALGFPRTDFFGNAALLLQPAVHALLGQDPEFTLCIKELIGFFKDFCGPYLFRFR